MVREDARVIDDRRGNGVSGAEDRPAFKLTGREGAPGVEEAFARSGTRVDEENRALALPFGRGPSEGEVLPQDRAKVRSGNEFDHVAKLTRQVQKTH